MRTKTRGGGRRGEGSGLISFVSLDRNRILARNGRLSLIIDDHGDRRAKDRISRKACVDIGGNKTGRTTTTTTSDQTGAHVHICRALLWAMQRVVKTNA